MKYYITPNNSDLLHFGILGMKWGVRRYQNKDGSLTSAGRKHYGYGNAKALGKELDKEIDSVRNDRFRWYDLGSKATKGIGKESDKIVKRVLNDRKELEKTDEFKNYIKERRNQFEKSGGLSAKENLSQQDAINKNFYFNTDVGKKYLETRRFMPRFGDNLGKIKLKEDNNQAFINRYGYEWNIAHLKDLGFNEEGSKFIADYLKKNNIVLGIAFD